jgi:peroxiredoxin
MVWSLKIMSDIKPLIPRQPVPALSVPLAGGGRFDLDTEKPERFTFVVFYRGLHCPICRTQLGDLESKLPEFAKRGVTVAAVSSDTRDLKSEHIGGEVRRE